MHVRWVAFGARVLVAATRCTLVPHCWVVWVVGCRCCMLGGGCWCCVAWRVLSVAGMAHVALPNDGMRRHIRIPCLTHPTALRSSQTGCKRMASWQTLRRRTGSCRLLLPLPRLRHQRTWYPRATIWLKHKHNHTYKHKRTRTPTPTPTPMPMPMPSHTLKHMPKPKHTNHKHHDRLHMLLPATRGSACRVAGCCVSCSDVSLRSRVAVRLTSNDMVCFVRTLLVCCMV